MAAFLWGGKNTKRLETQNVKRVGFRRERRNAAPDRGDVGGRHVARSLHCCLWCGAIDPAPPFSPSRCLLCYLTRYIEIQQTFVHFGHACLLACLHMRFSGYMYVGHFARTATCGLGIPYMYDQKTRHDLFTAPAHSNSHRPFQIQ